MCGLAGFYSPGNYFSEEDLRKMTAAVAHRGPDAEGYFIENGCGLGHRRLSIIDVSEKANQPMKSLNDRFIIIFNGEIYNYRELEATLGIETKQKLRTTSDTEVILEMFSAEGSTFADKLNGMFTIALFDRDKKELLLFRDRAGIKPLYYYWDGTNFAFASEMKSLLQLNRVNKTILPESLTTFLHLGYIPAPSTAYQSIFKMESGCMLKVSSRGLTSEKFTQPVVADQQRINEPDAVNELEKILLNAVSIQLRSDVPLGVFLSGGVDSSLIAALACSLSNQKVQTFSIGFHESSHDESAHAGKVAANLGTDHHTFMVSQKEAMMQVEHMLTIYDEPYADSSAIPTLLLSRLTRQHVKVALSGDGADELFHGYGFYNWAARMEHPLLKTMRVPVATLMSGLSARYQRAAAMLTYNNPGHLRSHIFSQEQFLFSENELKHLLNPGFAAADNKMIKEVNREFWEASAMTKQKEKLSPAEKQSRFDIRYYLQDDLLTKIDRASMHHSLEVRVPYLDNIVMQFAMNLPPELKIKNGIQKYILKKVLYKYLPEDYFRRPKRGFSIPLSSWLKNELGYLIEENLSRKSIEDAGIARYPVVKKYLDDFSKGKYFNDGRIWSLIVLHSWYRKMKAG